MSEQPPGNSIIPNISNAVANNPLIAEAQQTLATETETHPALKKLANLTLARQLGLMLILAISVAMGVAVVLWSQAPSYDRLYVDVSDEDMADILDYLNSQNIKYKIEPGSGAIMVLSGKASEIKLKLAGQGLPRSKPIPGYDLLDKEQAIGTSKSAEMMRFQRALEGEIAQTIMSIQSVKSAKVLLAIPVQSVFIRERKKPSASVILQLYKGRSLEKEQIESIIHLVASSVPQLEAEQVTVVDQMGRLLNAKDNAIGYLTAKQFDYKRDMEEHLMERIGNILMPLVGRDGVRTQLSADVDFSETDSTQENFDPKTTALRSEQAAEEYSTLPGVQGVPGALSNQPTPAGTAPETVTSTENQKNNLPSSSSKSATKNFEVDKRITHTRVSTGQLRRLTVAVVVDDKKTIDAEGKIKSQAYNQDELDRFTELVKQAVGFNAERGDQVTVTNVAFKPDELEVIPEIPIWKQAWFIDLLKQIAAAIAVLFLIFGVLRPAMRRLSGRSEAEIKQELEAKLLAQKEAELMAAKEKERQLAEQQAAEQQALAAAQAHAEAQAQANIPEATPSEDGKLEANQEAIDLLLLDTPPTYETRLEYVKQLVDNDSKLVSEVIKTWIK